MSTRLFVVFFFAILAMQLSGCGRCGKHDSCSTSKPAVANAEPKPAEILPSGLVLVDDSSFNTEIAAGVSFVNISAKWCRPCAKFAPVVEELAKDCNGSPKIAKMNFDECPVVCEKYEVTQIPCSILFKDGQEIARFTGLKSKEEVKQWMYENAGPNTVAMK
jgi:thioredoxin 1